MSHVLTISGLRGGSGKSVTALNLSVSLGLYEKKVLVVDCDPLGCLSDMSGIKNMEPPFDLVSVLNGKSGLVESISETKFHCLDILPSGFGLFPLAMTLSRQAANEKLLRLLIDEVRNDYDFVILDSPSSLGYLSVAAMAAADWLLAPMPPYANLTQELHALLRFVSYIRKTHGTELKIAGIVLNRCQDNERPSTLGDLKDLIFETMIPEDQAVAASVRGKVPLALHDIKSFAAQAYLGLAREIILAFSPQ